LIDTVLARGLSLVDVEVALRLHPRDLATCIDWWEEETAAMRRG
jgi:hypothetical protein